MPGEEKNEKIVPNDAVMSKQAEQRLREIIEKYPSRKSAVMPALYLAQEERGWVDEAAVSWVASVIGVPPAHVRAVATFYTMYYKRPVGRYHVQVCRTLSCMLVGARPLTEALRERFGIDVNQVSADGMWSFEEVECLGSCGSGPMVQINDVFFEKMSPEKLSQVLDRIEREKPDLRYSTLRGELGRGMPDCARSQIGPLDNKGA